MIQVLDLLPRGDKLIESVLSFAKFARRNKTAKSYAEFWAEKYFESGLTKTLKAHAKHMELMEVSMRSGNWNSAMLSHLFRSLSSSSRLLESDDAHADFVRKFEKKFGVKIERYESLSNGVILYLDPENTDRLNSKLTKSSDFEEVIESLDYICTRRGQADDINFGSFSEKLSKWIFIHSPRVEIKGKKFSTSVLKSGGSQKLASLAAAAFESKGNQKRKKLNEGPGAGVTVSLNLHGGEVKSLNIESYDSGMSNVSLNTVSVKKFIDGNEVPDAVISESDPKVMFGGYSRPASILGQVIEIPAYFESGETGVVELTFTEFGNEFYEDVIQNPNPYEDEDENQFWWDDLKATYAAD